MTVADNGHRNCSLLRAGCQAVQNRLAATCGKERGCINLLAHIFCLMVCYQQQSIPQRDRGLVRCHDVADPPTGAQIQRLATQRIFKPRGRDIGHFG